MKLYITREEIIRRLKTLDSGDYIEEWQEDEPEPPKWEDQSNDKLAEGYCCSGLFNHYHDEDEEQYHERDLEII